MQLLSARQAIHDAYAMHLTSKGFEVNLVEAARKPDFSSYLRKVHRSSEEKREEKLAGFNPVGFYSEDKILKENNNLQVCNAVEAGMIIAAVEGLSEPFQSWAKWAYGPRCENFRPEQGRFFGWLEKDVSENFESIDRVYREVTREKIRDVVAFSVFDYRSFVVNGRNLYPINLIINKCKIHRGNWKRDFEPWHGYYWQLCDTYLDKSALPSVASVVLRLKNGREKFTVN